MIPLVLTALLMTVHARALQPGELVICTIVAPAQTDTVELRAFSRHLSGFRVDDTHWRALVGIDLETKPGAYRIEATALASGAVLARGTLNLDVRMRRFPTRRLQVDEAFVNPPADLQPRIERETREVESAWTRSSPKRYWTGPFMRPVPGPANSQFGTRSIFNGIPRSPHSGGDFLSPAGTPVKAPNAGRVSLAKNLYFPGNAVIVDHGLGLVSMFAHLSEIEVQEGEQVSTGAILGKVGATGRVTGPHLHWAVRVAGSRVDPLSVLELLSENTGK